MLLHQLQVLLTQLPDGGRMGLLAAAGRQFKVLTDTMQLPASRSQMGQVI